MLGMKQLIKGALALGLAFLIPSGLLLAKPLLEETQVSELNGGRVLVQFHFTEPVSRPQTFTIQDPARITLDFMRVGAKDKVRTEEVNLSILKNISSVTTPDRTRVVLGLDRIVSYDITVRGNTLRLTLDPTKAKALKGNHGYTFASKTGSLHKVHSIRRIDFKRKKDGTGKILVDLSDTDATIDVTEKDKTLYLEFLNTKLPQHLERQLDVLDFATPVNTIKTYARGNKVKMEISAHGLYDQLTYQADRKLVIEFKPLSETEKKEIESKREVYKGKRLSLNFQDIPVRSVLQILADFTQLNLVASDSVKGNITLRLYNVPWDQALAIIMRTRDLDKRLQGNVMIVAPSQEIADYEKSRLQNEKDVAALTPLVTKYLQLNYAKAEDISKLLKTKDETMLSERGSVAVDVRTNTLLVRETEDRLRNLQELIDKLDVPVRQVLIDTRLVTANKNFERDLGIRWGAAAQVKGVFSGDAGVSGNISDANVLAAGGAANAAPANRLNINLPSLGVTNAAGILPSTLGLAFAKLAGGTLLDLELSALETENRGKVISSPRLVTANQKEAEIEKGEEIPYNESTSSGAAAIAFKKATLSLKVKPLITPDDRVILDLTVTQDKRGQLVGNVPAIDTNKLKSQVLVDNGQTVVLGGVFEQNLTKVVTRVPFLGRIPYLGALFKRTNNLDTRQELLIFVTPKILADDLARR